MNFIRLLYADVTIGAKLTLDANDGIQSVKDFRKELKEAQGDALVMAEKFGAASKEAAAAAAHVAQLRDKMEDSRKLVEAFNPETKFHAFGSAIQTVVGGFTALQGVMGLVGVESSDLQKQLLKVQSALAISQGLAQLQEGIKSFRNLSTVIQNTTLFQKANSAATQAAAAIQKLFAGAVDQTSTSFKFLKGAIAATGIGLLIVGLTEVVSLVQSWTSSTDDAADAQKRLADSVDLVNASLSAEERSLGRQRDLEVAHAKQRGASAKEIFDIEQKYRALNVEASIRAYNELKGIDDKAAKEKLESIKDQNVKGSVARIEFETQEAEKRRKAAEDANKKALDQARRDAAIRTGLNAAGITGRVTTERQKSPEEIELDNKLAANVKYFATLSELRNNNINEEFLRTKDEEAFTRQRAAQAAYERDVKIQAASAIGDALGALSNLVGKQTAAGKGLAIAQATINTFVGATQVLAAKSTLPEPFGTIVKIANVAAIIASGISAVNNIVKTQVPGGGGSAPSISSVSPPLAPQRPANQTTSLDQKSLNAIGSATVRAFVVESDVANNQERIRRLNRAARL